MPRSSPFIIELSPAERASLESTSRRYSAPYRDVVRARIVLLAAQGLENVEIAQRLDTPAQIVSKWRKRFFEGGLAGLAERSRPGRRPGFPPQRSSWRSRPSPVSCRRGSGCPSPAAGPGHPGRGHPPRARGLDLRHDDLALAR